jgi:hypothetical protein
LAIKPLADPIGAKASQGAILAGANAKKRCSPGLISSKPYFTLRLRGVLRIDLWG